MQNKSDHDNDINHPDSFRIKPLAVKATRARPILLVHYSATEELTEGGAMSCLRVFFGRVGRHFGAQMAHLAS